MKWEKTFFPKKQKTRCHFAHVHMHKVAKMKKIKKLRFSRPSDRNACMRAPNALPKIEKKTVLQTYKNMAQ